MKKVFMIGLILIFGFMVFGDVLSSETLILNTRVAGEQTIKVLPTVVQTVSAFDGATSMTYVNFGHMDMNADPLAIPVMEQTVYITLKTNHKANTTAINLGLPHLTATAADIATITTSIYYSVTDTEKTKTLASSVTGDPLEYRVIDGDGLRVISIPTLIKLKDSASGGDLTGSFQMALPYDEYAASVTIEYVTL